MGKWEGNVIINNRDIYVHVDYIKPSLNSFGNWSGYGYTTNSIDISSYETSIGSIIINHI